MPSMVCVLLTLSMLQSSPVIHALPMRPNVDAIQLLPEYFVLFIIINSVQVQFQLLQLLSAGIQLAQTGKDLQPQLQPSPQQSTGSVMMDLTDGNTRNTALARGTTADFTLGGYTRAIEQGKHPVWGSQQTAQLDDASMDRPSATSNPASAAAGTNDYTLGGYTRAIEQGSHPAWGSQRTAQLEELTAGSPKVRGNGTPGSVRRSRRLSLLGQSPSAAKRAQPDGQRSKWGFVPGEDDTLDLNLEKAGGTCICSLHSCLLGTASGSLFCRMLMVLCILSCTDTVQLSAAMWC